jgi:SAM-dependent methyltransferase
MPSAHFVTSSAQNPISAAAVSKSATRLAWSGSSELKNHSTTSLSILVPAYNEQYLIEASLKRLSVLDESPRLDSIQVIVVDDCSTDTTPVAIARFQEFLETSNDYKKFSWIWVRHNANQGKGAAIRTALAHASADLVVIHDADMEYHPQDLLQMVDLFLFEDADAVFGSRFMPGGYKRALFFRHALGNKFLTFLCDVVCDLNLTDMETCYKMVRADLLKSIPLTASTFDIEPELVIKLAKRGSRIFEVPISYSGRTYAEGKKIGWRDGVRALQAILRYAMSDQIYVEDAHGAEILMRLNRAPRFSRWMADVINPYVGDRVLEIGAGIGNLTLNLVPRQVYWATDVNSDYLGSLARMQANRPYLRVAYTDASQRDTYPKSQRFDSVICLNVVEHLADDVGALRNIREALEPGGRAIVLVPSGPGIFGTLDEVLGHFRRYTIPQLRSVSELAGFQVERVLAFNRPGTPAWWLNGKVFRRRTFGLMQIRLLNFLTPVFRRIDQWLPIPPLSIIAVLRNGNGSLQN